jgi:hypothetical protein
MASKAILLEEQSPSLFDGSLRHGESERQRDVSGSGK